MTYKVLQATIPNNDDNDNYDNNNNNDGTNVATNWSANQAFEAKIMQHDENDGGMNEYDYRITSNEQIDLPVLFFGKFLGTSLILCNYTIMYLSFSDIPSPPPLI